MRLCSLLVALAPLLYYLPDNVLAQAQAREEKAEMASPVAVTDAWVRWLPGTLPAAGYMVLTNVGNDAINLSGASSPDYDSIMLHQTVTNGTMSRMIMAPILPLPPHVGVPISPGGFHLMLSGARHPIVPGGQVRIDLQFSNGSTQRIVVPVSPATRTH